MLSMMVVDGDLAKLKESRNLGIDVKSVIDSDNRTLLHLAALHGRCDIISWLIIECGLDVDVKDTQGNTPLHEASRNSQLDAIRCLVLQFNACSTVRNNDGRTAVEFVYDRYIQCVSESEDTTLRQVHIINDNDALSTDHLSECLTPTPGVRRRVTKHDMLDTIKCHLKECSTSASFRSRRGTWALHDTIDQVDDELVSLLLDCGVETKLLDEDGHNFMDICMLQNKLHKLDILLLHDSGRLKRTVADKRWLLVNAAVKYVILFLTVLQLIALSYITDVPYRGRASDIMKAVVSFSLLASDRFPYGVSFITVSIITVPFILLYIYYTRREDKDGPVPPDRFDVTSRLFKYFLTPYSHFITTVAFTPVMQVLLLSFECIDGTVDGDSELTCYSATHWMCMTIGGMIAFFLVVLTFDFSYYQYKVMNAINGENTVLMFENNSALRYQDGSLSVKVKSRAYEYCYEICRFILIIASLSLMQHPLVYSVVSCTLSGVLWLFAIFTPPFVTDRTNAVLLSVLSLFICHSGVSVMISLTDDTEYYSNLNVYLILPCLVVGYSIGTLLMWWRRSRYTYKVLQGKVHRDYTTGYNVSGQHIAS